MNISHITTVPQMESFLKNMSGYGVSAFSGKSEVYEFIDATLISVRYRSRTKKEKGVIKCFLKTVTEYSEVQLKRLLSKSGKDRLKWSKWQEKTACRHYRKEDIALLHETDSVHRLAGPGTKKILEREYAIFGKTAFRKLKGISISHIYNLRKSKEYLKHGRVFEATKSIDVPIGIRRKPAPGGRPGFFRVDSVHQGDLDKARGVYFVNLVDEATQTEFVFCVPSICAENIRNVLRQLTEICPFTIINFHSDNGSEFINKIIAAFLNEERIRQTKSRPRKHNDNALVESKNGSVIRKMFGYLHIPATKENAETITGFCLEFMNPYLNFHRPCAFPEITVDKKGKERKTYPYAKYATPYEQLKSLPDAEKYLKKGVTFPQLDAVAYRESDTEFAKKMLSQKKLLFTFLFPKKM